MTLKKRTFNAITCSTNIHTVHAQKNQCTLFQKKIYCFTIPHSCIWDQEERKAQTPW